MKRCFLVGGLLGVWACTGSFAEPLGPDAVRGAGDAAGAGAAFEEDGAEDLGQLRPALCAAGARDTRGPRLLRRLTKVELEATVRSVFGFDAATYPGSDLPPDPAAQNGLTNQADLLLVGDSTAEKLMTSAERVADMVVSEAHLARILPCAATGGEACANTLLDTVGRRLYRRPLSAEERARYLALHEAVTAQSGSFSDFVRWAVTAMVSSPQVIYRSELGQPQGDGTYVLDGFERATALAFEFTGAPPDEGLLDAAERGELDGDEGLAQAARSLALNPDGTPKPAFAALFQRFVSQWLGLSSFENRQKDPAVFAAFTPAVRDAMREEIDRFVSHVVFTERGGMAELLTAPYTLLNETLSAYYGYGDVAGDEFVVTARPDGWGVGLLAQGALLALKATNRDTSPTQRGHLVRERFLCDRVPPPPPVVAELPAPTAANTTRERYEDMHASNGACAGCHALMDPIGFAFEHLDAGGRYRDAENGHAIDDRGNIAAFGSASQDVAFTGPSELASALSDRAALGACFGAYFASFSFGFDEQDSACLVSTQREALGLGEMSVLDFLTSLTLAPHFTTRRDG